MTVKQLIGVLNMAVEKGCENMPVAATINPDASNEIQDLAFGDVYLAYPFTDGKVFAITAIKDGFPEALEAFRLNNPDSDWDVCLPDGEIILCDKTRAECDAFIKRYDFIVEDTNEKFKFYTVKSDGIDRGYVINKP